MLRCLVLLVCCVGVVQQSSAAQETPARAQVLQQRAAAYQNYRTKLERLAAESERFGLNQQATALRNWLPVRDQYRAYVFKLPASLPELAISETGSDAERADAPGPGEPERLQIAEAFHQARVAQAEVLYDLALKALAADDAALAYELVAEVARESPEHAHAARIIGSEKIAARSEPEVRLQKPGGWRIDSTHYQITTSHSAEAGIELAHKLEALHHVWRQLFVSYYASDAEIAKWFAGGTPQKLPRRKHQVVLHRSRQHYNEALRAQQPQIEQSLGIYFDSQRTAHFFVSEEQDDATLYHEATHQLFQEMRASGREIGRKHNFWIIEAIACYMESLSDHQHWVTVGGLNAGRMPAARHRLLEDQFYVPLAELNAAGMFELQRNPSLPMIYSQAAGLATFLMHADQNAYRRPLMRYLQAVYTNRVQPGTLPQLAGQSSTSLDAQYREFMQQVDRHP